MNHYSLQSRLILIAIYSYQRNCALIADHCLFHFTCKQIEKRVTVEHRTSDPIQSATQSKKYPKFEYLSYHIR